MRCANGPAPVAPKVRRGTRLHKQTSCLVQAGIYTSSWDVTQLPCVNAHLHCTVCIRCSVNTRLHKQALLGLPCANGHLLARRVTPCSQRKCTATSFATRDESFTFVAAFAGSRFRVRAEPAHSANARSLVVLGPLVI